MPEVAEQPPPTEELPLPEPPPDPSPHVPPGEAGLRDALQSLLAAEKEKRSS